MNSVVTEGQHMTVSCSAESNPPSTFTLIMPSKQKALQPVSGKPNTYQHTFIVTLNDTGVYTCEASNGEGRNKSMHRKLVVKCELFLLITYHNQSFHFHSFLLYH